MGGYNDNSRTRKDWQQHGHVVGFSGLFAKMCATDDVSLLDGMVDLGFDVNRKIPTNSDLVSRSETFPLTFCASNGHLAVAEVLIGAGAEVNASEPYVGTALHAACRAGDLAMIRLLLDRGADIEATSDTGTALHIACGLGNMELIDELLARGADLKARNKSGETPYERAASEEVCDRLMKEAARRRKAAGR
jgi:ankyrin repeat protein